MNTSRIEREFEQAVSAVLTSLIQAARKAVNLPAFNNRKEWAAYRTQVANKTGASPALLDTIKALALVDRQLSQRGVDLAKFSGVTEANAHTLTKCMRLCAADTIKLLDGLQGQTPTPLPVTQLTTIMERSPRFTRTVHPGDCLGELRAFRTRFSSAYLAAGGPKARKVYNLAQELLEATEDFFTARNAGPVMVRAA